jgi:hypothetical protein
MIEHRECVARVHERPIMACRGRASLWVEIVDGEKVWELSPGKAFELAAALTHAATLATTWGAR